jgi:Tfp pilus assembly protein PilF
VQLAEQHFEKAMKLDPLNLAAAAILINLYDKNGQTVEADALSQRIASLVHAKAGR